MAQKKTTKSTTNETDQASLNGVLVQVTQTDVGESLSVSVLGETKATEAPSLLRLAANQAEKQLGL